MLSSPFGGVSPTIDNLGNPDIKWESLKSFNTGFELGMLNNRVKIDFDYYVKNGDKLDLGSVIGHTKATNVNPDSDGKLYYEIRKNNLAQNTYQLIDKKSLSKNFLR